MIERRKIIMTLGAGALLPLAALTPVAARAQQSKVWKIGYLAATTAQSQAQARLGAFLQGLRGLGYIEDKNIKIERRFAEGDYNRLPGLAAELVGEKVDIIVASSTVSTQAAKRATASIPIVAIGVGDPLGTGFAASLARPGGNVTGFSIISPDIIPKRIEILLAAMPKTKTFGVLANPGIPTYPIVLKSIQANAQKAGVNAALFHASSPAEIERAFAAMVKDRIRGVLVLADSLFIQQSKQITELTAKHSLAAMFAYRFFVDAGGLMSYGPDDDEAYRRAAIYVDKIFKGAKAGELPFEQPAKFHLVINGKTAKTLGIKLSQELLLRADEVIE